MPAAGVPAAGVPIRGDTTGVAERGVPKRRGAGGASWAGVALGVKLGVALGVMEGDWGTSAGEDCGVALRSGGAYTGVLRGADTGAMAGGVALAATPRAGVAREAPPPKAGTAAAALAGVMDTGNVPPLIAITPPHTLQRARTPVAGTLAGSTRNTERHSGQLTFTRHLRPSGCHREHGSRG
jgi:hypothetical protein